MYEIFLVVLLFMLFGSYIVYVNIWFPKVVNKTNDFFKVSQIEHRTMNPGKWFFVFIAFLFSMAIYDALYNVLAMGEMAKAGKALAGVGILIIWFLTMELIYRKKHVCLPLKKHMNVGEMIKSIEREQFTQIGEKLWYSRNWIRVSNKFFPKNAIVWVYISKRGRRATTAIVLRAVDGKEYIICDFSRYDKLLDENVEKLKRVLPISEFEEGVRWELRTFDDKKLFNMYMQSHVTMDIIEKTELLKLVTNAIGDSKEGL